MQTWELKSEHGSAACTGREEGSTLTWSNNQAVPLPGS